MSNPNLEAAMAASQLSVLGMIKSVEITNFRAFENFTVSNFARVNVIVGDNAVGKTALLEALYFALSGGPQKAMSLKQWRGSDIAFDNSSGESVFEGIYGDLFHDPESAQPISIKLTGDGVENRQLDIEKTTGDIVVPTVNRHDRRVREKKKKQLQTFAVGQQVSVPIRLTWTDEKQVRRVASVHIGIAGIKFEGTHENLDGRAALFAAQSPVPAGEAATQYSGLRKKRDTEKFLTAFKSVFKEISDISVETDGQNPVLLADVPWATRLLPLPALSGGTTRSASIMLAIALQRVVLVDEVESGIYHGRHKDFAKALMSLSAAYNHQLIMTSHSAEWIDSVLEVVTDNDDIAFWRMERGSDKQTHIRRFSLKQYIAGAAAGEMR